MYKTRASYARYSPYPLAHLPKLAPQKATLETSYRVLELPPVECCHEDRRLKLVSSFSRNRRSLELQLLTRCQIRKENPNLINRYIQPALRCPVVCHSASRISEVSGSFRLQRS